MFALLARRCCEVGSLLVICLSLRRSVARPSCSLRRCWRRRLRLGNRPVVRVSQEVIPHGVLFLVSLIFGRSCLLPACSDLDRFTMPEAHEWNTTRHERNTQWLPS